MIPHTSKPYRCILDLSFSLTMNGKRYPSVNEATKPCAPPAAMVQLVKSLPRIIAHLAKHYNPQRPFLFAKLDIKDGFWRVRVNDENAWHFCYVLPSIIPHQSIDDCEIVIPNSLQMVWCESPPCFCAVTETARDIICALLHKDLPHHPLEHHMIANISRSISSSQSEGLSLIHI